MANIDKPQDTASGKKPARVVIQKAPGPAPAEWELPTEVADPLAAALAAAMQAIGRETAPEALSAGLPLPPGGRLTPELAVRAARLHGAEAMLIRKKRLSDIPTAVLPVVLFLKGRDACLWHGVSDSGEAQVTWLSLGAGLQSVPLETLQERWMGAVLLVRRTASALPDDDTSASTGRRRHWLWSPLRRHWPDYFQVILASAIINVLALATPIFTMNVYDRVFPTAAVITLWSLVAGVGVALALDALLKWVRAGVVDRVGRRVDLAVSSDMFRHLSDLRLEARAMQTGTLVNTLKDYEQLRDFFSSQTVATLTDLIFGLLFIAVIAYLGGPLAYPPAIAFVFVLLLGLVLLIPLRRAAAAARQTGSVKNAVAVEAVGDLETLKAVGGHRRMQTRWEQEVTQSAIMQERSRRIATFATTATQFATQASSVGIVIIGVYLALEGQVTMGAVIAAMILSGRAMAPTAQLTGLFVRGSFAMSTLRSLTQIMALPSDADTEKPRMNAQIDRGEISLEKASLSYPAAQIAALDTVSMRIEAGEKVGIIGAIGAGKTSLVRLLASLYAPSDGMVLIDGLNMQQIAPQVLRRAVQLVPQEPVLFSGTLAENIAFGVSGARDTDILSAARIAGVDAIAAAHPDGFAMPISERGRNLSGGQRQMVALARALLPNPRVLILDEPTSSMDTAAERLFIARLGKALEARPMTLIVSTHRMGLLDLTDRILVLDKGQITADGPRQEVLDGLARAKAGS